MRGFHVGSHFYNPTQPERDPPSHKSPLPGVMAPPSRTLDRSKAVGRSELRRFGLGKRAPKNAEWKTPGFI